MVKLIVRALSIIAALTCLSVFYGCPGEGYEVPLNINLASAWLVDNTGEKPIPTENNLLPREAIAYEVTLYDTTYYNPYWGQSKVAPLSLISGAYAWSINETYILQSKLESIRVYTLIDFSDDIRANEEVTHLFVAELNQYQQQNILYDTMEQIVETINSHDLSWDPYASFNLYLTQGPTANSAAFNIRIKLKNGDTITTNTPLVTIID